MSTNWLAVMATVISVFFVLIVRVALFCLREFHPYAGVIFAVVFAVFVGPGAVIVWIQLANRGDLVADIVPASCVALAALVILVLFHRLSRKHRAWQNSIPFH